MSPRYLPLVSKDQLIKLYSAITAAIRSVDPDHMIILEGNDYAHDFSFSPPPADANVMYEFHRIFVTQPRLAHAEPKGLGTLLAIADAAGAYVLSSGSANSERTRWIGRRGWCSFMKANDIGWAVWPWKTHRSGERAPG